MSYFNFNLSLRSYETFEISIHLMKITDAEILYQTLFTLYMYRLRFYF